LKDKCEKILRIFLINPLEETPFNQPSLAIVSVAITANNNKGSASERKGNMSRSLFKEEYSR
jgi:hypothetical protein